MCILTIQGHLRSTNFAQMKTPYIISNPWLLLLLLLLLWPKFHLSLFLRYSTMKSKSICTLVINPTRCALQDYGLQFFLSLTIWMLSPETFLYTTALDTVVLPYHLQCSLYSFLVLCLQELLTPYNCWAISQWSQETTFCLLHSSTIRWCSWVM